MKTNSFFSTTWLFYHRRSKTISIIISFVTDYEFLRRTRDVIDNTRINWLYEAIRMSDEWRKTIDMKTENSTDVEFFIKHESSRKFLFILQHLHSVVYCRSSSIDVSCSRWMKFLNFVVFRDFVRLSTIISFVNR